MTKGLDADNGVTGVETKGDSDEFVFGVINVSGFVVDGVLAFER